MSRSLNELVHKGNFWLDENFHNDMTDIMGTMGGATGTLEFALDNLDDEDYADDLCEAVEDFNTAARNMFVAVDLADKDFWRKAGGSALKEIHDGLRDLGSALNDMSASLGQVNDKFSGLMNELQANIHSVLSLIESRT